tara:strand:- start:956 stop:1765 length:810 start_codon:yes stop_codon:yes gene_type:complete
MSFCLVSNICGKNQNLYSDRFRESHQHNKSVGGDSIEYFYQEGYPKTQPPEVATREEKEGFCYASKVYSLLDCIEEKNPEYIIWLDASVKIHHTFVNKTIDILDRHGTMLLKEYDAGLEWLSSDRFFNTVGLKREDTKMPGLVGTLYGFKISHPEGNRFFEKLKEYATKLDLWLGPCGIPWRPNDVGTPALSLDSRVKGHRHDQSVMSYLHLKYGFHLHDNKKDPMFYNQQYIQDLSISNPGQDVYYYPVEAPATHHPTSAHLSGGISR